ncbi:transcriptional regulator [Acaricomes phytoseiuli]|uniref:MmyB family transcriptional regulator n=1 Tax=Acaricomes phytoseiuli TaxID=291968 RepID=UPI002223BAA9|nr:transcriptional regulator [Acaricomes phytoseiuli]MCW1249463.1 transcriptional regulator [Acaricomes phytoseiuli]
MVNRNEVRDFLMSRRDRVQPEYVGLPRGTRRRVAGLRREEVAALAGVSDEILGAICRALMLDETEQIYLFDLARQLRRTPDRRPGHRRPAPGRIPPTLHQLLDAMTGAPAMIHNAQLDITAANALGRALYSAAISDPTSGSPANLARYVYLSSDAQRFYDDWEASADDVAAMLRVEVGRSPGDPGLAQLIEELNTESRPFAQRWNAHDVREHRRGLKVLHHAEVGELRLRYEALEVSGYPSVRLFGYAPDPDHPETSTALKLLASLKARADTVQH